MKVVQEDLFSGEIQNFTLIQNDFSLFKVQK
jgi:hypothetical protein